MPSVPQIIRSVAREKHVQQYIVEKDYALSYLLDAFVQTDGLGENLVLKGGTGLKKLYFADYRFSEDFEESMDVHVPVYSLMEIAAEKLRALLQSKARLRDRGWGASRVCRDYYDLWHLLQIPEVKSPDLIPLLDQKCIVRDVGYISPDDFISEELLAVAHTEWAQQLLPFVPDAPQAAELLAQVKSSILSIWE